MLTTCDPAIQPPPAPGTPFTPGAAASIDLNGTVTQVLPGNRVLLASGDAQVLPGQLDTAFADVAQGRVAQGASFTLSNNGVPFVFIDHGVAQQPAVLLHGHRVRRELAGVRSLEPGVGPGDQGGHADAGGLQRHHRRGDDHRHRGARLAASQEGALPTIDPANGTFSGPFPPANGATVQLGALVPSIVGTEGAAAARLDSITLGSAYQGIPHLYWFTAGALGLDPATSTIVSLPILQPEETGVTTAAEQLPGAAGSRGQGGQVRRGRRLRAAG